MTVMLNFVKDTLSLLIFPSVPSELGHQRNLIGSCDITIFGKRSLQNRKVVPNTHTHSF